MPQALVVRDVPADICVEQFFDADVTDRLLDIADEALAAGVSVDVRRFVAAYLVAIGRVEPAPGLLRSATADGAPESTALKPELQGTVDRLYERLVRR